METLCGWQMMLPSLPQMKKVQKKALEALEVTGGKCGLELSEEKTKILRIRELKVGEKIGNYKIEEETKYLGNHI